ISSSFIDTPIRRGRTSHDACHRRWMKCRTIPVETESILKVIPSATRTLLRLSQRMLDAGVGQDMHASVPGKSQEEHAGQRNGRYGLEGATIDQSHYSDDEQDHRRKDEHCNAADHDAGGPSRPPKCEEIERAGA